MGDCYYHHYHHLLLAASSFPLASSLPCVWGFYERFFSPSCFRCNGRYWVDSKFTLE